MKNYIARYFLKKKLRDNTVHTNVQDVDELLYNKTNTAYVTNFKIEDFSSDVVTPLHCLGKNIIKFMEYIAHDTFDELVTESNLKQVTGDILDNYSKLKENILDTEEIEALEEFCLLPAAIHNSIVKGRASASYDEARTYLGEYSAMLASKNNAFQRAYQKYINNTGLEEALEDFSKIVGDKNTTFKNSPDINGIDAYLISTYKKLKKNDIEPMEKGGLEYVLGDYLLATKGTKRTLSKNKTDIYDRTRRVAKDVNVGELDLYKKLSFTEGINKIEFNVYSLKIKGNNYLLFKNGDEAKLENDRKILERGAVYAKNLGDNKNYTFVSSQLSNQLLWFFSESKFKFKEGVGIYYKFHNYFAEKFNRHVRGKLLLENPVGKDLIKSDINSLYLSNEFLDKNGIEDLGNICCKVMKKTRTYGKRDFEYRNFKINGINNKAGDSTLPDDMLWASPSYKWYAHNIELQFLEDNILAIAERITPNESIQQNRKKRKYVRVCSPYLTGKNQGDASIY